MSKKPKEEALDKGQRINKHTRSHSHDQHEKGMKRLQPSHKPIKKQHINILDAYEKRGEACEDMFEE